MVPGFSDVWEDIEDDVYVCQVRYTDAKISVGWLQMLFSGIRVELVFTGPVEEVLVPL